MPFVNGKPSSCAPWNKGKKDFKHIGSFKKGHHSKTEFQKGNNHPNWRGGKGCHGYVFIYKPEYPFCYKNGYILEHRLVMEKILKRSLKSYELIHHLNGIKNDNRPENLMLTIKGKNWHPCICPKCGFEFLIK